MQEGYDLIATWNATNLNPRSFALEPIWVWQMHWQRPAMEWRETQSQMENSLTRVDEMGWIDDGVIVEDENMSRGADREKQGDNLLPVNYRKMESLHERTAESHLPTQYNLSACVPREWDIRVTLLGGLQCWTMYEFMSSLPHMW